MFTWIIAAAIPVALVVAAQTFYIVDEKNQVIVTQVGQYLHSARRSWIIVRQTWRARCRFRIRSA